MTWWLETSRRAVTRKVQVFTWVRALLALLIVASIATILITPDPSDDVLGILHQHHTFASLPVFVKLLRHTLLVPFCAPSHNSSADFSHPCELLEMVCTHLC